MLEVKDLETFYGKSQALFSVSISVGTSEIVALVGSNGAGKSTLLKSISGLLRPASGRVFFEGRDITGDPSHAIVDMGIAHIPEGRRLFPNMSVLENLEMGAYCTRTWKQREETLEKVYGLLPLLKVRQNQSAGTLSGSKP